MRALYLSPFLLVALFAVFPAEQTKAENGCPTGMTPNGAPSGTPGANQCIPIPGYGGPSNAPQAPTGYWATRWGAFADDHETGKVGIAGSKSSEGKAKKAAIAHCRDKGGVDCKLQLTFYNQCAVAVAGEYGDGTWYRLFQSAGSLEQASELAKDKCEKQGAKGCRVFFSDCSLPVWVG